MSRVHEFQKTLSPYGPFKFIGAYEGHDFCEHCGRTIKFVCRIKDAKGKVFRVGSTCVYKSFDKTVADIAAVEVERIKHDIARKKRMEKQEEKAKLARIESVKRQEIELKKRQEKAKQFLEENKHWIPVMEVVNKNNNSSFCRDVATNFFQYQQLPRGKAIDICKEIYAKSFGKKGSQEYMTTLTMINSIITG